MRKVILNIGLNNNPLSAAKILEKVRANFCLNYGDVVDVSVKDSFYLGEIEPTLILDFSSPYKLSTLIDKIEQLASVLTQDCIGANIDGNGILIYRIDYKGTRLPFDNNFFLTL